MQSWLSGQKSPSKGEDGVMLIGVCLCFNLHVGNVEAVRRFLNGAVGLCSYLFSATCTDVHILIAKERVESDT